MPVLLEAHQILTRYVLDVGPGMVFLDRPWKSKNLLHV
jgi:hypothetical protein